MDLDGYSDISRNKIKIYLQIEKLKFFVKI